MFKVTALHNETCVAKKSPPLRSIWDRLRQITLFEIGGLLLIAPPFAWASGEPLIESAALLAVIAFMAAVWNAAYNTTFDWFEGRATGRTADRRPFGMRVLQAIGFEIGILVTSLPLIVWWTDLGWMAALAADIGLAIAYTAYAFAFNLAYDRYFPIASRSEGA